jgi:hypothetical protein
METGYSVKNTQHKYLPLWLAIPLLFAGCQGPKTVYCWGHYESVVYDQYAKPEKASPELLAAQLEEDLHKAASANKPVPPGFHAQLGYLYAQSGRTDLAREQYELEKQMYPESAVFMDRFLNGPPKK